MSRMKSEQERVEESWQDLEQDRKVARHAVLSFVWVLVILLLAVFFVSVLFFNKPVAEKKEEEALTLRAVVAVEVKAAEGGVTIQSEGIVTSQRVINLTSEVAGKLIRINPNLVPGGKVGEGEVLVEIEPTDFRVALEQAKAAEERTVLSVADAQLAIEQEEARRDQALRDWAKLAGGEPSDLLARKPQLASARARLASARAEVASAEAEVKQASRNLERTVIRAPFDAVVRAESVEVGAVLAPGTALVTLFSERELEIELPLRLEDYALLNRDEKGAVTGVVELTGQLGLRKVTWPGRLARTSGEIDQAALTAGVVVAIEATDGEGELRLPPPGLFVQARLEGQSLAQSVVVPREAVREGDVVVVVDAEGVLSFRSLEIVRSNDDEVITRSGVAAGERVVLTRMAGAIEGMKVEIVNEDSGGDI